MFLTQPKFAETVRESARRLGSCPNRQVSTTSLYLIQQNAVREVRYDWVRLRRWYTQLDDVGGWVTRDIDEAINRLAYRFVTQASLDAFSGKARARGIPSDALALTLGPPVSVRSSVVSASPSPHP